MKNKDIERLIVTDLFKEDEYIIPIYQRNYSWEDDQIKALITDICDKDEQSDAYYLGTLIVNKRKENKFEVIDGQQRLTTLFLLLSFLNNEKDCHYDLTKVLSFDTREKSNKILSQYSKNEEIESDKDNTNTIVTGYTTIEEIFKEIPNDNIKKFKDNLEQTTIIRVPVPENVDLNHYFEVMNTRGEQLELHEIAKNKFIEVLYDENDDFDSKVAEVIWEACSNMNRYVQMNFLKGVRDVIFGDNWDSFENKDFDDIVEKLKNKFKKVENKNKKKNIFQSNNSIRQEYSLQEILESDIKIDEIEEDDETEEKDKKSYESIISFPNFLLQVNYLLIPKDEETDDKEKENKKDEKLLDDNELLTHLEKYYKDKEETKKEAKRFIFDLLKYRYYFDRYIVKRDYTRDNKSDGVWAIQKLKKYSETAKPVGYNEDNKDIDTDLLTKLQASLRITYTSPKTMKWISEVLSKIGELENEKYISESEKEKAILENSKQILEEYCREQLKNIKKNNPSENPFGTGFQIPRIVFTYLDYVLYRDNEKLYNNKDIKSYDIKYRTSIEHFYPQNPKENKMESGPLNNFGNLALITVSGNSTVSNFYPKAKYDQWKDSVIKQSPKLILMAEEFNKINDDKIVLKKYENCIKEHGARMRDILDKELNPT